MSEEKNLHDRVDAALDIIRPALVMDGGNVELVHVSDEGVVLVKLVGACHGCPASTMTLKAGIEATLKEHVPEVSRVESVAM
jgi:Fe-S cluster biogenesis protein NfuA